VFVGQNGDQEVAVRANPDYYNGRPALDGVVFRLIRDDNARVLATLGGSADLVQNALPPLLLDHVAEYPHLEVRSAPSFKLTYIVFNMRHPALQDVRVRQAVALAIDREAIIAQKFSQRARLATGLLAPEHWAYDGEVTVYPYDPERARALLDAAGYPEGPNGEPRFSLVFKVTTNRFRRSLVQLMAYQLGQVGIAVEVQAYEWGTFMGDLRSGNFDLATLQWPSVVEPDLFYGVFHSSQIPPANNHQGANRGGYSNPAMDALLEEARGEIDPARRGELYGRVQRLAADELPYVSLWHEDNFVVTRVGLVGYEMVPNARFTYLPSARWVPAETQ
jgi:peptide/nickel transport system substrate-binding protein